MRAGGNLGGISQAPSSSSSSDDDGGLSTGAVVGIAVGCAVAGVLIAVLGIVLWNRRRQSNLTQALSGSLPSDASAQGEALREARLWCISTRVAGLRVVQCSRHHLACLLCTRSDDQVTHRLLKRSLMPPQDAHPPPPSFFKQLALSPSHKFGIPC